MSKRKKLRTAGEGIHPPKPPKSSRLGHSNGGAQRSESGHLHRPEESEDSSRPAAFTELSREVPGGAISSSPSEETGAAPGLLRQPEKEPIPLPHSQETLPEPSTQEAGSQLLEESLGLALQEARRPGEQTLRDGARAEKGGRNLVTAMPGSADSQPLLSLEGGTGPSHSDGSRPDPLMGQSSNMLDGGNLENSRPETERAWVLGDGGQKGHLPSSEGKEPEGGAQGGVGVDLPEVPKEGVSIPGASAPAPTVGLAQEQSPATPCLKTWSVAQDLPDPSQIPSGTGGEAEQSCSRPGCTPLRTVDSTDMSTNLLEMEVARPSGQGPGRGCSRAQLDSMPHAEETTAGRGDLGLEDDTHCDMPASPAAVLAPTLRNQEPAVDAEDPGHLALEVGQDVSQTQVPNPVHEGPGRRCMSLCTPPEDRQAAELGSQGCEHILEVIGLSLPASGALELRDTVDGPIQETRAHLGGPDTSADPARQPQHSNSSDQAMCQESLDMDLDFLPDSQIQDALDTPDFEAPPEQVFPAGSKPGLCWLDPSLGARGDLVVVARVQPRPSAGVQAQEASRMEDATATVRGLVVELSNLNRLIMSTHRDLEAFKRLSSRKAKPPGKAPSLYPSKGAGNLSRGEQSWRDL